MAALAGAGHVIRYVNPAFCRLVGSSSEALLGTPFADTVRAGDECLVLVERVYRTGAAETHTVAAQAEPQSPYGSYAVWPVLDAEHRPAGVVVQVTETTELHRQVVAVNEALVRAAVRQHELTEAAEQSNARLQAEISERTQLESELAQRATKLERLNDELQQFAYVVSHDLREPLRAITSFTQLLTEHFPGNVDAQAAKSIAFVVEGAQRMQALIADLHAYTRVSGQVQEFTAVDSAAVLMQVLEDLRLAIDDKAAVVTADPLPTVHGDANQLRLVFQNLLGNALKFSGERPRIHVEARHEGAQWVFAVQDNGIGLDPQHAERIFQVFQRLHTRSEYPGTGIGLAICKKIIERHEGRIWVESAPGQGATFYFTLPAG
jgi:PAS domain S-box-containing protein